MKRTLFVLLAVVLLFFVGLFVGCEKEEAPAGGGATEITGSILYVREEDGTTLGSFWSESTEEKKLTLTEGQTYRLGVRPSFRGSKAAVYLGDCAEFSLEEGSCEISYLGDEDHRPTYECTVLGESDFSLTVTVGGYTQTILVLVVQA